MQGGGAIPVPGVDAVRVRRRGRRRRLLGLALVPLLVIALVLVLPGGSVLRRACHLLVLWAPAVALRSPAAVTSAIEASGPVFIKLAQWLSTRRDLLSAELCDAMGVLHERVVCIHSPADRYRAEDLVPGLRIGKLLGGGCIAQVYSGEIETADGSAPLKVAVKVRRARVDALLQTDLSLLRWVARMAQRLRPELEWLAMEDAVDNFGWYLVQQLNLTIEAANLRHFTENYRSGRVKQGLVRVPGIIAVSESVMVTEVAQGVSLSTFVKQNHPASLRNMVFTALIDLMARMALVHEFVHGDLHPGNIFVSHPPWDETNRFSHQQPTITLIDAGIAIQMTRNISEFAKNIMRASFHMDALGMGKALVELHTQEGFTGHARDLPVLERKAGYLLLAGSFMCGKDIWGEMFETYEEYRGSRVSEYFVRMVALLSEHRVRVSPTLWSLMTAFALIEGSVAELGYGVNVLRAATPYLFNPLNVLGRVGSKLQLRISEKKHYG